MSIKTILITSIYNEEYLLPFWLHHHKNMFDEMVVIDYNSTDKSLEICKSICPHCTIITTRNKYYDAEEVDKEYMDIEDSFEGIKIVLNTTEFLFCETNVRDLFINDTEPVPYAIHVASPYSKNNYDINSYKELFNNLFNDDIVYHFDRGLRYIHNYSNGNYKIGRHLTNYNYIQTNKAHIIWFGYYPMNDRLMKRKLQIKNNIPQSDRDKGFGVQHFYDKETILYVNDKKSSSGISLQQLNPSLYNILESNYKFDKSTSQS